jgi:energy-coupling factor transporter ATP-binding protein EcfA2
MLRIREITLDGFRGYRRARTFTFPDRPSGSLLIYGPNGYGKSSITDAFEFLVNPEGTLERLGQRRVENMSGRGPLRHVALEPEREASVRLAFADDRVAREATRKATSEVEPLSEPLKRIANAQRIPYIIRGTELRNFIDETTPTDRYKEFARCLAAARLMALQSDVRSLRTKLRSDTEETRMKRRIDADAGMLTSSAVTEWDDARVLEWLNARIRVAAGTVPLIALTDADGGLLVLKQLQADEMSTARRLPLERAQQILRVLLPDADKVPLRAPFDAVVAAQAKFVEVAQRTAQGDYLPFVTAAIKLLHAHHDMEDCPLCGTSFTASPLGSRHAVQGYLQTLRDRLGEMRLAEEALVGAKRALEQQHQQVAAQVREACTAAGVDATQLLTLWNDAHGRLVAGGDSGLDAFVTGLRDCDRKLAERIERMAPDAPRVYEPLMTATNRALELQRRFVAWQSTCRWRLVMLAEIEKAVTFIDERIYGFFQRTIDAVNHDTIAFYSKAQKVARVPVAVKVRLLDEENADSRGVEVLVDMYDAKDLKPRAVLSDSQRHTLGLALRLALIRRFNKDLPFVVLDDVVTSYDAEYRRDIAIVLADDLADLQMLVLTHDNLFYRFLKSRIGEMDRARWNCTSILRYDPEGGPFILGSEDADDIDRNIKQGQPAGNEIRQYVEEWLHKMAHGLGAKMIMRRPEDPYNYAMRELFDGVIERAKAVGFDHVLDAHNMRGFVGEMRDAVWLNKASHYQENPYHVTGAAGTDASFWRDFKEFAELFKCPRCRRQRFQYNVLTGKVNCAHPNCNLTLRFEPPPAA